MEESSIRIFMTFLRVVGFFIWFIAVIIFLQQITIEFQERSLSRAAAELSEVILQSDLIVSKSVFSKAELDKYQGSRDEPYARLCNYGYRLDIENLDTKEKWAFGYEPEEPEIEKASFSFPVGVSSDIIHPAKMTLTLYDTWTTRMTCLASVASISKKVQQLRLSGYSRSFTLREQDGNPSSNYACTFILNVGSGIYYDKDCRYLPDVAVHEFDWIYLGKQNEFIQAMPIKKGVALPSQTGKCDDIKSEWIAGGKDEVGEVALCIINS